jgi:hypothetical protein
MVQNKACDILDIAGLLAPMLPPNYGAVSCSVFSIQLLESDHVFVTWQNTTCIDDHLES